MASAGTAQPSTDDGHRGSSAAGKAADTLAARFKDIERGKLAYAELQRLLDSASSSQPAASSKDAAAGSSTAAAAGSSRCSLAELVAAADPVSSERLVDVLLRTGQSELLRQLLQACCHASTDLMVALLDAKAPLSLLQAVLEHHAEYAPGGSGRAWQAGVASSGWNGTDGRAYQSPGCQDVLAWHALQHPDTRVLAWLLSQPSIDPAVHLADGSNLLHAAVDLILRDTPACSGEHVSVLIDAVRQRLTPRQLMADPSSGRLPPDLQFLHHACHTALYKVSAAVKAITYSQARRERGPLGLEQAGRAAIGAAAGAGRSLLQNLTTTKASRKKQKQQEAILRTIRKAQGQGQQDDSQPAEAGEDPAAAELRHLVQLERVGQVLLLNGGVDPLLEEATSTPGSGWGFLQGLGRSGPAQPAEGEGRAAGSTWLGSAVSSAAGWLGYGSGFLCETQSALDKLRERRTAEAEQAYDDAQYKQSLAAKTAFDALGIQEPVDQQQWSEEEFREVCRLWLAEREKRKNAKVQKAQVLKADKAWYESTSGQESLKTYTGRYAHEPVNPWIEQEYKPLRGGFEDLMLRSVLRQLAVTAGSTLDLLDRVEQLLEDKPKVLDYVTKTYFKLKPGDPKLVLKVKEVFAGARESLAFSVLRAHPREPQLLQPLLRANEATLYQRDPTANILWLGLGAPGEAVFETLLDVSAPGGPKGNPLAVTYSTGGNLVHALLQHRPGDTPLLRRLLVKLLPTKATCRNAVNAVNEATQQTPLALAVSMQQLEMAELLVDFGADPLAPSLYPQPAAEPGFGQPAATEPGSSKHQQSPLLTQTTLLHLLLGPDRQQVLGADLLGTQERLRQACMDAAGAEAQAQRAAQLEREQYERDLVSGSAAEQIVARGKLRELSDVSRHVLGTYVDAEGETLVLAAARYCCSTGDAQPLLQLLQAGADWTLPSERGVSALLLLLQHKARGLLPAAAAAWLAEVTQQSWTPQMLLDVSACCSQAQAEDEELLLDLLMQLPWGSMLGLLQDVSLHERLIQQQQWMLAQLLLTQAEEHLLGPAASGSDGSTSSSTEGGSGQQEQRPGLFSSTLCHSYVCSIRGDILRSMLRLGLDPHKVNAAGQTLLHAALEGRCSTAVARRLVEGMSPLVLVWPDSQANMPLHYLAALPDLQEPERLELLKTVLKRCFTSTQTLRALAERGHNGKLPHEIPTAASVQAVMLRAYQAAEQVASADDRSAAAAAVARQEDPFSPGGGDLDQWLAEAAAAAAAAVQASSAANSCAEAQLPPAAAQPSADSAAAAVAVAEAAVAGATAAAVAAKAPALGQEPPTKARPALAAAQAPLPTQAVSGAAQATPPGAAPDVPASAAATRPPAQPLPVPKQAPAASDAAAGAAPAASAAEGDVSPTGNTSWEHLQGLLSLLPASQRAAEEAAAAGSRQQSDEWVQRSGLLASLLEDAAAGVAPPLGGASKQQQEYLQAELVQLRQELPGAADLTWDNNTWEATFTREAFQQFAALPYQLRQVVGIRLHAIVNGRWQLQPGARRSGNGAPLLLPGGCSEQHDMAQLAPGWRRRLGGISNEAFAGLVERLAGVRVFSTAFLGVGRLVFEVAPDYTSRYARYVDMVRIWGVTLTDAELQEALDRLISSHSRADGVLEGIAYLRPLPHARDSSSSSTPLNNPPARAASSAGGRRSRDGAGAAGAHTQRCSSDGGSREQRAGTPGGNRAGTPGNSSSSSSSVQEPVYYEEVELEQQAASSNNSAWTPGPGESLPIAFAQRRPGVQVDSSSSSSSNGGSGGALLRVAPPATHVPADFTMLRLLDLSGRVMAKLLSPEGLDTTYEDVPFRLSRKEAHIVDSVSALRAPHLVMGRSGTGKTTIIVHAVFKLWLEAYTTPGGRYRGVFVTASPTLKQQVEAAFGKLQMAVLKPADKARVLAARSRTYHTLAGIPDAAFPLFLSGKQYLAMLDGSLGEEPFLWHRDPVTKALLDAEEAAQQRALEALLDQDAAEDPTSDAAPAGGQQAARQRRQDGRRQQRELTYSAFQAMWRGKYAGARQSKTDVSLPLFHQELMSLIKGSAQAVASPTGILSLEEYLSLGRKRSEAADMELRQKIYALLSAYAQEKSQLGYYDRPDLVHSLYTRLSQLGAAAEWGIQHIIRDEVQDFVQGELLLDVLVLGPQHAANITYCGDTAQSITRGVGFRFADVKTIIIQQFAELRARDKRLLLPDPRLCVLDVNFRSHAGILDVGNAVVGVLRELSPHTIDRLPREHAFFEGPRPLLLGAMTAQDVAILTAGHKGRRRQIEFGAHQSILVRSTGELDLAVLPDSIRHSNALILEVLQSKGLEFQDVLIVDFLSTHPTEAREWRALLSYLRDGLEQHPAVRAEEQRAAASGAQPYGGEGSSMLDALQHRGSGGRQVRRPLLASVPLTQEERLALKPLVFDPDEHAGLIDDLRYLYVAITRTKNNLVIFESNPLARASLYYYLRRLGVAVEIKTSLLYAQDSLFAGSSSNTREAWAARGISLMQQQDWTAAMHCFSQARDRLRHTACEARLILETQRTRTSAHRAAVLLVEAAAGTARRHEQQRAALTGRDRSGGTGSSGSGSGAQLPPVTPAEYGEWLDLAAGLYSLVLGKPSVVLTLYCQIQKFDEASRLCAELQAGAGQQGRPYAAALAAVQQALMSAVSTTAAAAAAAQQAGGASSQSPRQRRAESGAAAKAAAAAATARLHAACQQLLAACAADLGTPDTRGSVADVGRVLEQTAAEAARRQHKLSEAERARKQEAVAKRQALIQQAQQQQQQQVQEEVQDVMPAQAQGLPQQQQQQQQELGPLQQADGAVLGAAEVQLRPLMREDGDAGGGVQPPGSSGSSSGSSSSSDGVSEAASPRNGSSIRRASGDLLLWSRAHKLCDGTRGQQLAASSSSSSLQSSTAVTANAAPAAAAAAAAAGTVTAADGSQADREHDEGSAAAASQLLTVCSRCGLTGHLQPSCSTAFCSSCERYGHSEDVCAQACTRCGALGHVHGSCQVPCCQRCGKYGHTRAACCLPKGTVVSTLPRARKAAVPQEEQQGGPRAPVQSGGTAVPEAGYHAPGEDAGGCSSSSCVVSAAVLSVSPAHSRQRQQQQQAESAAMPAASQQTPPVCGVSSAGGSMQQRPLPMQLGPQLPFQQPPTLPLPPQPPPPPRHQQQHQQQQISTCAPPQALYRPAGVVSTGAASGPATTPAAAAAGSITGGGAQQQQQPAAAGPRPAGVGSSGGGSSSILASREQLLQVLQKKLKALEAEKTARQAAEVQVQQLTAHAADMQQRLVQRTCQLHELQQQQRQQQQQQDQSSGVGDLVQQLLQQIDDNTAAHAREVASLKQQAEQQLAAQAEQHQQQLAAATQDLQQRLDRQAQQVAELTAQLEASRAAAAAAREADVSSAGRMQQLEQQVRQQQGALEAAAAQLEAQRAQQVCQSADMAAAWQERVRLQGQVQQLQAQLAAARQGPAAAGQQQLQAQLVTQPSRQQHEAAVPVVAARQGPVAAVGQQQQQQLAVQQMQQQHQGPLLVVAARGPAAVIGQPLQAQLAVQQHQVPLVAVTQGLAAAGQQQHQAPPMAARQGPAPSIGQHVQQHQHQQLAAQQAWQQQDPAARRQGHAAGRMLNRAGLQGPPR